MLQSKPLFTPGVSLCRQLTQLLAGRALEGADPQKWPRWVQASTQLVVQSQGALKTPLCGN